MPGKRSLSTQKRRLSEKPSNNPNEAESTADTIPSSSDHVINLPNLDDTESESSASSSSKKMISNLPYSAMVECDDFLTDVLLDALYLGFRTHKMKGSYYTTGFRAMLSQKQVFEATECTAALIREMVSGVRSLDETVDLFVSYLFPTVQEGGSHVVQMKNEYRCFYGYVKGRTNEFVSLFREHAKRYFSMYALKSGFAVDRTYRYNSESTEDARIISTRKWSVGEEIRLCTATMAQLTPEEEKQLQDRDFSVIYSDMRKCFGLLMGPGRFVNHDCNPNVTFLPISQSRNVTFKVIREIQPGEEIFCEYARHYFGQNNCECLCESCESEGKGVFMSEEERAIFAEFGTRGRRSQSKNAVYNPAAYFRSILNETKPEKKNDGQPQIPCRTCGTNILGENQAVLSASLSAEVISHHGWEGGLDFDTCRLCRRHFLIYHQHFPKKSGPPVLRQPLIAEVPTEEPNVSTEEQDVANSSVEKANMINSNINARNMSVAMLLQVYKQLNGLDSESESQNKENQSIASNQKHSQTKRRKSTSIVGSEKTASKRPRKSAPAPPEMFPPESRVIHGSSSGNVVDLVASAAEPSINPDGGDTSHMEVIQENVANTLLTLSDSPLPVPSVPNNLSSQPTSNNAISSKASTTANKPAQNKESLPVNAGTQEMDTDAVKIAVPKRRGRKSKAEKIVETAKLIEVKESHTVGESVEVAPSSQAPPAEAALVYWNRFSAVPSFRFEKRHQRRNSAPCCFPVQYQLLDDPSEYAPVYSNMALNLSEYPKINSALISRDTINDRTNTQVHPIPADDSLTVKEARSYDVGAVASTQDLAIKTISTSDVTITTVQQRRLGDRDTSLNKDSAASQLVIVTNEEIPEPVAILASPSQEEAIQALVTLQEERLAKSIPVIEPSDKCIIIPQSTQESKQKLTTIDDTVTITYGKTSSTQNANDEAMETVPLANEPSQDQMLIDHDTSINIPSNLTKQQSEKKKKGRKSGTVKKDQQSTTATISKPVQSLSATVSQIAESISESTRVHASGLDAPAFESGCNSTTLETDLISKDSAPLSPVSDRRKSSRRSMGKTKMTDSGKSTRLSLQGSSQKPEAFEPLPLAKSPRIPGDLPAPPDEEVKGHIPVIGDTARLVWVEWTGKNPWWWPAILLPEQAAHAHMKKFGRFDIDYPETVYIIYVDSHHKVYSGTISRSLLRVFDPMDEPFTTFRQNKGFESDPVICKSLSMFMGLIDPPPIPCISDV